MRILQTEWVKFGSTWKRCRVTKFLSKSEHDVWWEKHAARGAIPHPDGGLRIVVPMEEAQ